MNVSQVLKLSQGSLSKSTVGYIVNMLSNDAQVLPCLNCA